MKIFYNQAKNSKVVPEGIFYGLTFFESKWGQINVSVKIRTVEELMKNFGSYFSDTEVLAGNRDNKNSWMQAWNFLQSSRNLKIFRIGKGYPTESFTGSTLTSVTGSSNSHNFFNSLDHSDITSIWDSSDNGSKIYYHLNDFHIEKYIPNFVVGQLIFAHAKYCGILGNEIGVSIANYQSNFSNTYVFKHEKLRVADSSSFSVGDIVTGDTTSSTAEIKQIINNDLYILKSSKTNFSVSEGINSGTTTISSIASEDDVENKVSFSELFDNQVNFLTPDKIAIVITLENEIVEKGIVSLSSDDDKFIENWNSDYVEFIINSSYTNPNYMDPPDRSPYIPWEQCNEKLIFGCNTICNDSDYRSQLPMIKGSERSNFAVLFCEYSDMEFLWFLNNDILEDTQIMLANGGL